MKLGTRLAQVFVGGLPQDDLFRIASKALDEQLSKMSGDERVALLQRLVEENLEWALAGMDRSQRARLMNSLLPVIARHFPLEELDILGAFAGFETPQILEE